MNEPPHVRNVVPASWLFANILTTFFAAVFNMLVMLIICFSIGPGIEQAVHKIESSHDDVLQIQKLLNENQRDLEEHRKVIKRLNDALDAAAAKAKAAAEKKK